MLTLANSVTVMSTFSPSFSFFFESGALRNAELVYPSGLVLQCLNSVGLNTLVADFSVITFSTEKHADSAQ